MAVRYVQRCLNGGGRSIEEVEPPPPPVSLEVGEYLYSVQREVLSRGCKCRSKREVVCLWVSMCISFLPSICTVHPIQMPLNSIITGLLNCASGDESETETLPVTTFPHSTEEPDHPPPHQGAPDHIKDKVLDMGSDPESTESDEVRRITSFHPPTPPHASTSYFVELLSSQLLVSYAQQKIVEPRVPT